MLERQYRPETAIVVGGGIVGRIAALRLLHAGLDVTLIDPQERLSSRSPASWGNAGHIATEQVRPLTNPAFLRSVPRRLFAAGGALDLGWRRPDLWLPWSVRAARACLKAQAGENALTALLAGAMPAWERLVRDLSLPDLLIQDGHLMLWHEERKARAGMASWLGGSIGTASVTPCSQADIAAVSNHLLQMPVSGLRFSGTGQVAAPRMVMAELARAFSAAGGRLATGRALSLSSKNGRMAATLANGETLTADVMLVTAGVDTGRLLRGTGLRLPLIAERGYHIEWDHGGGYDIPPLVFEERSLIVTRFGKRLRAASFVEFTAEDAPPDPRKWLRLERHVGELGLPVASTFDRWLGARPTLPDYLPAIGPYPKRPGLYIASGHQHLGLTLAPWTAEIVSALMMGQQPPLSLAPFNPGRFGRA